MAVCTFFIFTGIIEIQKFKAPYLDKLSSNSFHLQINLLRPKLRHYSFLRIWSHSLKKSLMENFIFCYSFLRIWSHSLKKSLMENFIFCAVTLENSNWSQNCLDINKDQPYKYNATDKCP